MPYQLILLSPCLHLWTNPEFFHSLHGISESSRGLLLLLLRHFSHVQLCATPQTAVHQAPPSLGFSRQEHWSGLPLPSPMHESEKWKWSHSVMSNSQRPHGLQPIRLLHPWDFPGKSTGLGCHYLLRAFLRLKAFNSCHVCLSNFISSHHDQQENLDGVRIRS